MTTQTSLERLSALERGQTITNVCAGEKNPHRLSYFVALVEDRYKNKYGIVHTSHLVKCTDGHRKFWKTGIDFIYPGHIDYQESCKIFEATRGEP
jgi:hypothetical protein